MAATTPQGKLLPLHDLKNVNTVLGMLYDANGVYRASFEPNVFYNTILLDTLKYGEENYVHLKFAETINIRRGETTARFRRWAGLTPTLQPLKEGVPPAPDKHAYETIEVGNVFSFGRWSEYTDRVDLSVVNEVIAERSLQYGEVANQTKELYARKTWLSTPNEFYANFKDFADLGFGDEVTLDDLRFLIARMKRMQVKPISGKFLYVTSSEFINGLIDDPRVKQYMAIEQTTGKLWGSGEAFDMFEITFVPTMLDEFAYPDTEYPGVYEKADGTEVIRLYAVAGQTIFYLDVHQDFVVQGQVKAKKAVAGVSYLSDGTAIEDYVQWEVPTNTVALVLAAEGVTANVVGTGEAVTATCVVRKATRSVTYGSFGEPIVQYSAIASATADLATINTLIDQGAFMQLPVHRGILFGGEAIIKMNVEGLSDQPQIIVKALGASGVADPINQRQSVGFKVDGFGLAIKRPEAICVTYGIPKHAELAALTDAFIGGRNWEIMDGQQLDDSFENHITTAGAGALRVDSVNVPAGLDGSDIVGSPIIAGFNDYPKFSASVAYAIGDVVIYNNIAYEFVVNHSAGAFVRAEVKKFVDILEKNPLDTVNSKTSNVK
jgi:hypothetical protein